MKLMVKSLLMYFIINYGGKLFKGTEIKVNIDIQTLGIVGCIRKTLYHLLPLINYF